MVRLQETYQTHFMKAHKSELSKPLSASMHPAPTPILKSLLHKGHHGTILRLWGMRVMLMKIKLANIKMKTGHILDLQCFISVNKCNSGSYNVSITMNPGQQTRLRKLTEIQKISGVVMN